MLWLTDHWENCAVARHIAAKKQVEITLRNKSQDVRWTRVILSNIGLFEVADLGTEPISISASQFLQLYSENFALGWVNVR